MPLPEIPNSAADSHRAWQSFAMGSVAALLAAGTVWLIPASGAGVVSGLSGLVLKALPPTAMTATAAPSISFLAALGCGMAAAWVGSAVQPRKIAWSLVAAGCLLTVTQSMLLALRHTLWEPLPAVLAMIAGCLTASWRNAMPAGASAWFKGRVSPEVLARLSQARDLSFLSADQRPGTVLTCRLLNEGALREVLPAPDFLKLCEAFRARAAAVLMAHGACIDPTESTGVRAFFGLPLESGTAADEAVKAALALEAAFKTFSVEKENGIAFASSGPAPIAPPASIASVPAPEAPVSQSIIYTGSANSGMADLSAGPAHPVSEIPAPQCAVGLATGTFTAGLTGNTYTVLSDAVEVSRWLAAQNANYQTRTLLDATTHLRAAEVEDRPLEVLNPPEGAAMEIYHLLGSTGTLSPEQLARRDAFRDAIVLLRAGHAGDALRRFADAREGLTEPDHALDQFEAQANDQARRDAAASASAAASPGQTQIPPLPLPPPLFPPRRRNTLPRKLPRP